MHHSYLDKYARQDSLLHRWDPRVKLLLTVSLVVLISLISAPGPLFILALAIIILMLTWKARIPLAYLLLRSTVIIPFSGFAALSLALTTGDGEVLGRWGSWMITTTGLYRASSLLLRSWLAVCCTILLINTCPFDRLLRALRSGKIPELFLLLLSFLYRFLYLLWDEAERLMRARNVRYFGGRLSKQPRLIGHLSASLFLRTYERAERVQNAMLARGWDGEVKSGKLPGLVFSDWGILLAGYSLLLGIWLIRHH